MNPFTSSDLTAQGGPLNIDTWDARRTNDNKISVIDVIADVRNVKHHYAAVLYNRLLDEERVQACEMRPLPPRGDSLVVTKCDLQRSGRGVPDRFAQHLSPQLLRWLRSFGNFLAQQIFAGTAPKQLFAIWAGMKHW